MAYPENLQRILDRIGERRTLAGVVRQQRYTPQIPQALMMVEMIGKARNPKFVIDDDNRWTYTQLIKWLYADDTMQALDIDAAASKQVKQIPGRLTAGIYIAGATGTGKSWAMEILNILADVDEPKIELGGEERSMHFGCYRAEDIWEEATTSDEGMAKFKTIPILCIQDLGSEPVSDAVRMGTRREPLRQILEARGDRNDLITLITSNFGISAPEIERRYTDRVVSRLKGMCNFLVINGIDRRTL